MGSFIVHRKLFIVLLACAVIVSGELFCRMVLGLGDPPLYVADSQIEYMMKPDQDVERFGNHVFVNHWGMRSPDISQHKQNADEIRVLIFGDSVVNGGSETDQSLLATTLMQQRLQATLGRPVVVGNISAGSWGPGNWLAYAKRYGFFDADVLVLVVGSGDFSDNPTFEPLKSSHPTQKPLLALQEAVFRYLPRYLPSFTTPTNQPIVAISAQAIRQGDSDLRQFLSLAKAGGRQVMMIHHPDRPEFLTAKFSQGHDEMRALASSLSIPFTDLLPLYSPHGVGIYRDGIHPNAQGQKIISDALYNAVLPNLISVRTHLNNTPL